MTATMNGRCVGDVLTKLGGLDQVDMRIEVRRRLSPHILPWAKYEMNDVYAVPHDVAAWMRAALRVGNRRETVAYARAYLRCIEEDDWKVCNEGVLLANDYTARIMQGGKRLLAIEMSGRTVPIRVEFGNVEQAKVLDSGERRSPAQYLHMTFADAPKDPRLPRVLSCLALGVKGVYARPSRSELEELWQLYGREAVAALELLSTTAIRGSVVAVIARAIQSEVTQSVLTNFCEALRGKPSRLITIAGTCGQNCRQASMGWGGSRSDCTQLYGLTQAYLKAAVEGRVVLNARAVINREWFGRGEMGVKS